MCGAKGKDVYAKSFGFGFDLTLKNSPKLVLRILPIEFAKFIIKLFSVGTFLNIINPSNEPLNISIYDMKGREVRSQQIIFDSIDISDLSNGFYSLIIKSGKRSTVKKIVVK